MTYKDKLKDRLLWEATKSLKRVLEMDDDEIVSRYDAKKGSKPGIRTDIRMKKALSSPFVLLGDNPSPTTHLGLDEVHLLNIAILRYFEDRYPDLIKGSI